jgi:hypothetical protein
MSRAAMVDISVLGDKELSKALANIHGRLQRKIARQALRKSAKRTKGPLVQAISGSPVGIETGELVTAMNRQKVLPGKRSRASISALMQMPSREELNIKSGEAYWPAAVLEYGSAKLGIRPLAWVRATINRIMPREQRQMRTDIGKGIQREWKKGKHWITTGKK